MMKLKFCAALRKFWREWVKPMLIVFVICGSFRSAVADWNDVPTGSMKPTILEGDRILVNKMAYGLRVPFTSWWAVDFEGPQRGDVVVFFSPDEDVRMVKRVVGVPGDRVEIRSNRLSINGQPASYEPLEPDFIMAVAAAERPTCEFARERFDEQSHPVMSMPGRPARRNFGPITVPEGRYFVLGDNRDNSRDSRWFGCIERHTIVGRATGVVFSVDANYHYLPRRGRFFHGLP